MLELAKECHNLDIFTHVSTAYVNCNRTGYIDEVIYDQNMEVETMVKNFMQMNVQEI